MGGDYVLRKSDSYLFRLFVSMLALISISLFASKMSFVSILYTSIWLLLLILAILFLVIYAHSYFLARKWDVAMLRINLDGVNFLTKDNYPEFIPWNEITNIVLLPRDSEYSDLCHFCMEIHYSFPNRNVSGKTDRVSVFDLFFYEGSFNPYNLISKIQAFSKIRPIVSDTILFFHFMPCVYRSFYYGDKYIPCKRLKFLPEDELRKRLLEASCLN